MSKKVAQCLDSWRPRNDRIIETCLYSHSIKTTVIRVYSPRNEAVEEVKDDFYEQVQKIVDGIRRHDLLFVIGDRNAE